MRPFAEGSPVRKGLEMPKSVCDASGDVSDEIITLISQLQPLKFRSFTSMLDYYTLNLQIVNIIVMTIRLLQMKCIVVFIQIM